MIRTTGTCLSHAVAVAIAIAAVGTSCSMRGDGQKGPIPGRPLALPITVVADPGSFQGIGEAATAEARVDWWDDDTRDDDACTESFAATELRRYLAASMRIPEEHVRLATPREALPDSGTVIVVGTRRSIPSFGGSELPGPPGTPEREGFRIRAETRNARTTVTVTGGSRVGALYGSYALLERLGFRFFGLGVTGTVLPSSPLLPATLDFAETPAYGTRGFWAWEPRGNPDFFLWMARNRMDLWTIEERDHSFLAKLGIRLVAGGHQIQKVCLDPDVYFDKHPEWYGLADGRRDRNLGTDEGTNFCSSNSAAVAELAHNLVRELGTGQWRHADVLALWMLDNAGWCTCQPCVARGTPTDRLFDLLRVVSDSLLAAGRDERISRDIDVTTLAFLETLQPPRRPVPPDLFDGHFAVTFFPIDRCYVHGLADPQCAEVNASYVDSYRSWVAPGGAYRGAMEVGEYYSIGELNTLPVLLSQVIRSDAAWYFQSGARRFHTMHAPTRLWGTWTVNHVLLSRLLWNPAADMDSILSDFWSRYYPTTGSAMRRYAAQLETASGSFKLLKHRVRVRDRTFDLRNQIRTGADAFVTGHLRATGNGPGDDPRLNLVGMGAAMRAARSTLDSCRAACRDSFEARRLDDEEHRFAYGEMTLRFYTLLLTMYTHVRNGDDAMARQSWPALWATAQRLRRMRDVVQVSSSHANAADGFEATRLTEFYELMRQHYGEP